MLLARRQRGFSILVRSRIFFGNAYYPGDQDRGVDKAHALGQWRRRKGRRLEDILAEHHGEEPGRLSRPSEPRGEAKGTRSLHRALRTRGGPGKNV